MAGGSISLSEKLLVAGAFVALVAMAVGTEDDPGVIAASSTMREGQAVAAKFAGDAASANPWSSVNSEPTPDAAGVAVAEGRDSEASPRTPPQLQEPAPPREADGLPSEVRRMPSLPPS